MMNDPLYGEVDIRETVLLDLLQSQAVQRLRGVLQHGVTALIGITAATTRYDHSVGAMLLVRRLGAGLEEQIAALLHDISHTAFSHVIDYVFHNHTSQGYHEEKKEWFIAQSDLPAILAAHGYDWRRFLHEDDFPLLEQPAPALCADRLDYFLRDSRDLCLASDLDVQVALAHLSVDGERIVVDELPAARWLAETYIQADEASWANFREVGLYELAAQAIRMALQLGVLSETDLWGTDAAAWAKLQAASQPELRLILDRISPATRFVWDEEHPDFRVATKLRTIDPDVRMGTKIRRLSELDGAFARRRAAYLHSKAGLWPMRVVMEER